MWRGMSSENDRGQHEKSVHCNSASQVKCGDSGLTPCLLTHLKENMSK